MREFGRELSQEFTFYVSRFTQLLQPWAICPILPPSEQTEENAILRGGRRRLHRVDGLPAQPRQGRHGGLHQAIGRFAGGARSTARNGFWRETDRKAAQQAVEFDLPGLQCAAGHQRETGGNDFGRTLTRWREGGVS